MARRSHRGRSNMYGLAPTIKTRLTQFNEPHHILTTMGVGKLYPIDCREVLPGSYTGSNLKTFSRLTSTFIRPVMDDIYLDTFEFFVPLRLCQENLEDVFGNSNPSAYADQDLAEIAHFDEEDEIIPNDLRGTVWDYLGLCNVTGDSGGEDAPSPGTSILPIRAFALIWNEYFRNQNITGETYVHLDDSVDSSEFPNVSDWSETNYAGKLPPVTRMKDMFSTAFPSPQKGPSLRIPVFVNSNPEFTGLKIGGEGGSSLTTDAYVATMAGSFSPSGTAEVGGVEYANLYKGNWNPELQDEDNLTNVTMDYLSFLASPDQIGTINDLRLATQLQRYRERDAWYGTRYREYLYAAYGVISPDSRIQVPEFLGRSHTRLNVSQVLASTQSADYELGQVAGMSVTLSNPSCRWRKSFTEHGYVITCACIRYRHLYSNGVRRQYSRILREHFYDKLFDNIGMQRIFSSEIFQVPAKDLRDGSNQYGYTEPWIEYRIKHDRVSGQMRPYSGSLGEFWSLADAYDSFPGLSTLAYEDSSSFERVISAPDASGIDPFIVDFRWDEVDALPVPAWSIPGRMDH